MPAKRLRLLALIDTPLPSICDDVDVEDDARFLCDLVNFANRCAGEEVRIDYDKISRLPASERFAAALADARDTGLVPPEMPEEFIRRLVHVGEANVRVLQSYRPTAAIDPPCSSSCRKPRKHWPRSLGARRQTMTIWAGRDTSAKLSSCTECRATISA